MNSTHHALFGLRGVRRLLLLTLPFFAAVFVHGADAKIMFDVPAGEAGVTLKQFAQQAGREIMFPAQSVDTVRTNAVQGEFTVKEGLGRLLAETPLHAIEDVKTGALVVQRLDDPNAPRAAQVAKASDRPEKSRRGEEEVVKLGEFEVFGSKLINADLPRSRDDVQPYVTFSREQLQASQAPNLEDFFRSRLPMNQTFSSSTLDGLGVGSSINLRGLGSNQTLILLDGRRLAPGVLLAGFPSQPNVNGIPLGMIERIEVLPATASGIYGGGATGGVINIITRKDYAGVEVGATYQNTFDTDAATRRIDVNGSLALEDGRTMVTLNYSRSDGTSLKVQDRDFATRSRALLLQNNPAAIYSATTPPAGYLANIRSQNGANLVLKPQFAVAGVTALNSPITFVPPGYAGPTANGAGALLANAGRYDLGLQQTIYAALASLQALPTVESFGLGVRRRFGSRVEAYVDASQMKNDGSSEIGIARTTTIAANAPNNPFTTAITVNFPELAPIFPSRNHNRSERLAAGAMVRLPADWSVGADYIYSRSETGTDTAITTVLGDPDGTGPGIPYTTALSTGVLDVLRDLYATPLNLGPYLMPSPYTTSRRELIAQEWTLRGSGPLLKLPAGPLTLSTSVQWREERILDFVQTLATVTSPTPGYQYNPEEALETRTYYAEIGVPIFSPKSQIPLVRGLEFQASVRHDDFKMQNRLDRTVLTVPSPDGPFPVASLRESNFRATKATAGLKYTVTEDLALRASFGTGFLPPTLYQLTPGIPGPATVTAFDPRRSKTSEVISFLRLSGGSPDLVPESSESTSAGLVFTPRFAPGLRLSVDYTRIVKTKEIVNSFLHQDLLNQEALFPDRVVRAPLTAQDQALGYTGGVITQLDQRAMNRAGKRLEAWDMQADYTWKPAGWGEFQAFAVATWQPDLETQSLATAPWVETAGYVNGAIEWRGNGGLTWARSDWTLGWNMQYHGTHYVYNATTSAAAITTAVLNQGSATIPSQTFHDVSASYRWGAQPGGWQRLLAHSQLTLGVQNVFNTSPEILASTFIRSSNYSVVGDPLMRRYTISLRKKL